MKDRRENSGHLPELRELDGGAKFYLFKNLGKARIRDVLALLTNLAEQPLKRRRVHTAGQQPVADFIKTVQKVIAPFPRLASAATVFVDCTGLSARRACHGLARL